MEEECKQVPLKQQVSWKTSLKRESDGFTWTSQEQQLLVMKEQALDQEFWFSLPETILRNDLFILIEISMF